MGLPLVVEPLDPDRPDGPAGYRIPRERYELPDPGLAEDELAALRLAAVGRAGRRGLGSQRGDHVPCGSWPAQPRGGRRGSPLDTAGVGRPSRPAGVGPTGRAAARTRPGSSLGRELPGGDGRGRGLRGGGRAAAPSASATAASARPVDPWRLSFRNGQWYLSGWDHDRAGRAPVPPRPGRRCRRGRRRPPGRSPGRPGVAPATRRRGGSATTKRSWPSCWSTPARPLGRGRARTRGGRRAPTPTAPSAAPPCAVTNRAAFRSFVLGFLDHAEVLGPPDDPSRASSPGSTDASTAGARMSGPTGRGPPRPAAGHRAVGGQPRRPAWPRCAGASAVTERSCWPTSTCCSCAASTPSPPTR